MTAVATHACAKCGRGVYLVDLYGTSFFEHKPRRDCLTWWHVDVGYFPTHQAVPGQELSAA